MSIIKAIPLGNGENLAASAIHVQAIPSYKILDDGGNDARESEKLSKRRFTGLLNELYQSFERNQSAEFSVELVWLTTPVEHQPFEASINLYVVVRVIALSRSVAMDECDALGKQIKSSLQMWHYDFEDADFENYTELVSNVDQSAGCIVRKADSLDDLRNNILPVCYGYDLLPENDIDLRNISDILIHYPNALLSIQLTPVTYSAEEQHFLTTCNQALVTLSRGIMEQGIGNVTLASAPKYAQTYAVYAGMLNLPLFQFGIFISGSREASPLIASRISNQLGTGKNNVARMEILNAPRDLFPVQAQLPSFPWYFSEIVLDYQRNARVSMLGNYDTIYRLSSIISLQEASEFFRLPIGNESVRAGFVVNESERRSLTYRTNVINTGDLEIGTLKSSSAGTKIGIALKDLTKHVLIAGTPGSGKTTFCVGLLDRLWKDYKIPFLVIEPAKNEYRAMLQSIPDLQIFTPGKNSISPFLFNPFVPPLNVRLEAYKSTLKTAFAAAVSMSSPLDKIFEDAVNNCYSDHKWLDFYTSDDGGEVFNISDFINCFRDTFEEIGYTGDARNIGRAGVVRLSGLANLFDNYSTIPIEDLLTRPTVIELAAIENSDQKALIISLLLLSILSYVNANYLGDGKLKNVILLEEAHVLLDADTNAGEGEANPSRIAQQLVKRMLAEIRSYGVGVAIADQSPRKVTTDVVALTDMKIIFRLVEAMDRRIIADSIGLNDNQTERLMRMKPGEIFLFFNRLDQTEEVVTPDYRLENNIDISLTDQSVARLSTYWNTRQEKLRPYPQCAYSPYCSKTCEYRRRIIAREIARRICRSYFKPDSKDFKQVRELFGHITALIKQELNGEEFTPELRACVKMHIWRNVRYTTRITFDERTARDSIQNS